MRKSLDKLTPCEFKPGFFKVPGLPFSASEEGLVYCYNRSEIPKSFFDKGKVENNSYIQISNFPAHRLIALTFLEFPEGKTYEDSIVNHKNGLKFDNHVSNLEWTDYPGNSIHAYQTGLRDENIRVKTFNVLNGEIRNFYSIWECARVYGVNGGRVHGYLNRKIREVLFLENYLLIEEEDEFPDQEDWSLWVLSAQDIPHIAFNVALDSGVIFNRRCEAFRYLNIPIRKEQKMVKKARMEKRQEMENDGWIICPYSRFKNVIKDIRDERKSREERYANYHPHKGIEVAGLLNSNV